MIVALSENLVPNFFPMISPAMQMANVTAEMMRAQTRAIRKSYSAMVKPTDRASMEVAIVNEKRPGKEIG